MTLTTVQLWQRLEQLGIATPERGRAWTQELAAQWTATELASGQATLERLVEAGKVTRFQAECVLDPDRNSLRVGDQLILQPVGEAGWQYWFECVADVDREKAASWCRWLSKDDLASLKPFAPSLERAKRLVGIKHAGLMSIVSPAVEDGKVQLVVSPLSGNLLATHALQGKQQSPTELIRQIAAALAEIHNRKIVHGRVMPDRIWLRSQVACLAIDPICEQTSAAGDSVGVLSGELPTGLKVEHFHAPEMTLPGATTTLATDVYQLGCVWWWLLTGKPPHPGDDAVAILAGHCGPLPSLPATVQLSESLKVCLFHMLGRNLDARFPDAVAALAALEAAIALGEASLLDKPTGPQAIVQSVSTTQLASTEEPAATEKSAAPAKSSLATNPVEPKPPAKAVVTAKPVASANQPLPAKRIEPAPSKKSPEPADDEMPAKAKLAARPEPLAKPELPSTSKVAAKSKVVGPRKASKPASNASQAEGSLKFPARDDSRTSTETTLPKSSKRKRTKKKGNNWLLPTAGICGTLIVLLLGLKLSGVLESGSGESARITPPPAYVPPERKESTDIKIAEDQRYTIVASEDGKLWLPPRPASPIPLDHLAPGAQMWVSVQPNRWQGELLNSTATAVRELAGPLEQLIVSETGFRLEELQQVTIALYPPASTGGPPKSLLRAELTSPKTSVEFSQRWSGASLAVVDGQQIFAGESRAYWPFGSVAMSPDSAETAEGNSSGEIGDLSAGQAYQSVVVGSVDLVQEAVRLGGDVPPLLPHIEQLWESTDQLSDILVFGSPAFLFSEGRWLVENLPDRLSSVLREQLGSGRRGLLFQSTFSPQWYAEVMLMGRGSQNAGEIAAALAKAVDGLPERVENWLVDEQPHASWLPIALRYPQMLRAVESYTRVGVENGVAFANFYLPSESAGNVLLATWLASQPTSTAPRSGSVSSISVERSLTIEEYLNRSIRIRFSQEPIEVALQLLAEEANDGLPAGTQIVRFELDGDAFENAGITRNQQLRDFDFSDLPVRQVLTEIAKRGNPSPGVTDLSSVDQQLVWVVQQNGAVGGAIIRLTTRAAATARGDALPMEFQ